MCFCTFSATVFDGLQPVKPLKATSSKLHQEVPVATGSLGIVNESARVHIQEGYNRQSIQALIEVVEVNGIPSKKS